VRRAWVSLARAAKLAHQSGEVRLAVEAAARRGRLMLDVDREHDAELELREALLLARTTSDRRGEALVSLFLGTLLAERASSELEVQSDESLEAVGDGGGQNGDGAREARATLERSLRLAEELGLARVEALCSAVLARVDRLSGHFDSALTRSEHASQLVERFGAELLDRIVVEGTRALLLHDVGRKRESRQVASVLRARVTRENRAVKERLLRKRHGASAKALLASSLSADGPLYPRVRLEGLEPV
jgi:hypothetical protein